MKDLQRVYSLLSNEITKAQHKIDGIDRAIKYCNRLNTEYWYDKRAEAVAYLDGDSQGAGYRLERIAQVRWIYEQ